MSDSPEVSVLIHELGGMLSSVQGFAHIAEANPDHPNRDRFIGLAASEARRAAQALKDLHLVRALDRGALPASPAPVDLSEVLGPALATAPDAEPAPAGSNGVVVVVEPAKVVSLLSRVCAAATAPVTTVASDERVDVVVPIAPAGELARRVEAIDAPYPNMLALSLLRRLLRHWGGDVTLAARDHWTVATIGLPRG